MKTLIQLKCYLCSCWRSDLFFFNKFIYLIYFFWLHWVFVAAHGLSLVAASGPTLRCSARASHCGGSSLFLKVFLKFIYLFIYFWMRCVFVAVRGISLVAASGATFRCGAWASHCSGFSCCGARALGARASVVVARGLSSCGSWALELRLSSCGTRA